MQLHPYVVSDANNADERTIVTYRLAVVSAAIGTVGSATLAHYSKNWQWLGALSVPATIVIFLFLNRLLNAFLWRWRLPRYLLGISTPVLNMIAAGKVQLKKKDGTQHTNKTAQITFEQTYRNIGIAFDTDRTRSDSVAAAIFVGASKSTIVYRYTAKNKCPDEYDFPDHDGAADLVIIPATATEPQRCDTSLFFTSEGTVGTIRW